ncbi:hypothetical protein [Cellulomonas endometrii]|uniref:hypothetical protein n=1 Tax=Cellulomonas endometrii TaxID=3036301 RepID=UPI0024ADC495|nr:hypothetical protein [Cellulomonas endometrii]
MPDRVIRRLNGPRGSVLVAGAAIAAVHAGAYVSVDDGPVLPSGLDLLDRVVPLPVYAVLWGAAMLLAVGGAWRTAAGAQRDHLDAWGFGSLAGMLTLWGSTYLAGWGTSWFAGQPSRQWVFGVIYLAVAVMIGAAARMTNPGSAGPEVTA